MERHELEVRTRDGRLLRAQLAGAEEGPLVVYHPGTPGTRNCFESYLAAAAGLGLRHVCYSRPGYEGSDRNPGRSYADCALDTAEVADALGADKFYVTGCSGGGGPALACAALLGERVIAAAAIATPAPRGAEGLDWEAGLTAVNGPEMAAVAAGDVALERCLDCLAAEFRKITTPADLLADDKGLCAADKASLRDDSFMRYQLDCYRRVGNDGRWGWFDDDLVSFGNWGFDPARIAIPVSVWQGGEDRVIPPAHGRWLADHVPGARFHFLPEDGHVSVLPRHYGAILKDLIASG